VKIALVSAEYPYDEISAGGIGTYVFELSRALESAGHYTEVFCASLKENGYFVNSSNVRINKIYIPNGDTTKFKNQVELVFEARHKEIHFDVMESPEYGADALYIKNKFPNLPLVVKFHTPLFLAKSFENRKPEFINYFQLRYLKLLNRNTYNFLIDKNYKKEIDDEFIIANKAEIVCSPSLSLIKIIKKNWNLNYITHVPNLFSPSEKYLDIPQKKQENKTIVSFFGSLCTRKGIEGFLKVIPAVVKKNPNIEFRFIGKDNWGRKFNSTTKEIFDKKIKNCTSNYVFIGNVPLVDIPNYLKETDICIFPSIWENFPYVCLETMSAGKYVIASKDTGMAEMLSNGGGMLIDPLKPNEISKVIIESVNKIDEILKQGLLGRKNVIENYNSEKIIPQVIKLYTKAIELAKLKQH